MFASRAGIPRAVRTGNVTSVPPPATELTNPPAMPPSPAITRSRALRSTTRRCRHEGNLHVLVGHAVELGDVAHGGPPESLEESHVTHLHPGVHRGAAPLARGTDGEAHEERSGVERAGTGEHRQAVAP